MEIAHVSFIFEFDSGEGFEPYKLLLAHSIGYGSYQLQQWKRQITIDGYQAYNGIWTFENTLEDQQSSTWKNGSDPSEPSAFYNS